MQGIEGVLPNASMAELVGSKASSHKAHYMSFFCHAYIYFGYYAYIYIFYRNRPCIICTCTSQEGYMVLFAPFEAFKW